MEATHLPTRAGFKRVHTARAGYITVSASWTAGFPRSFFSLLSVPRDTIWKIRKSRLFRPTPLARKPSFLYNVSDYAPCPGSGQTTFSQNERNESTVSASKKKKDRQLTNEQEIIEREQKRTQDEKKERLTMKAYAVMAVAVVVLAVSMFVPPLLFRSV